MEVEAEYSFAVAFDHKAATVGRAWAKAATVGRAWAKAATVGRALYGDDVANTCDVNVYG